MKIKFDYAEAKVPKEFIKIFEEAKKEALRKGDDINFWKDATFEDWIADDFGDLFLDYHGKIVDKEIARFIIARDTGTDWGVGGYPRDEYMEFTDNGFKFTICCFGWANDENMKSGGYDFIGWKEKIRKRKTKSKNLK